MKLGISQKNLAGMLGISTSYMCQIEGGTREPSITGLKAIVAALLISADELIGVAKLHTAWCGIHVDKDGEYDVYRKIQNSKD